MDVRDTEERGKHLREIYKTCGVLFEQIGDADLDAAVESFLLKKVGDLLCSVELLARLIDQEVCDG